MASFGNMAPVLMRGDLPALEANGLISEKPTLCMAGQNWVEQQCILLHIFGTNILKLAANLRNFVKGHDFITTRL